MVQSEQIAQRLHEAHREGRLLRSGTFPALEHDEVAIETGQALHRLRDPNGTRGCGWKLGYTSAVMRQQMGVTEPNYAPIYADEIIAECVTITDRVHPRVEPEIAITFGEDVAWSVLLPLAPEDRRNFLHQRLVSSRCALEIVDSVWEGYDFTWGENTADGSSGAGAMLGDQIPLEVPLDALEVRLSSSNGRGAGILVTMEGSGSDVFGHPLDAVVWLVEQLGERGETLAASDIVLTGGITASLALSPGTFAEAEFSWGQWRGRAVAEHPAKEMP